MALVLSLPQGKDVVRSLVDSSNLYIRGPSEGIWSWPAVASYFKWACLLGTCIWSGLIAWYWPHLLTRTRHDDAEPGWFLWVRRILGLAPILTAIRAIIELGASHPRNVWIALLLFVLTAIVMLLFFVRRRTLVERMRDNRWFRNRSLIFGPFLLRTGSRSDIGLTRGDDAFIVTTFGLSLLMLLIFALPDARTLFANLVGSGAIAFGAIGSIIATISALAFFVSGVRLPIFTIGLILLLLFSMINDNHGIRPAAAPLQAPRPSLFEAYAKWQAANRDYDGPIILVATAGGASRAGYWTSTVLRALDDRTNGNFARHVFAISSVSGGTLGAFGYAAWVADHPMGTGHCAYSHEQRLKFDQAFAGGDYLSPAIAGLLYPDLVQKFVPFPLFQDRAHSLEEGFEYGWSSAVKEERGCKDHSNPDRFSGDFRRIWENSLQGNGPWVPLVLANGTLVENGKRVITAPVWIDANIFEDSHDFFDLMGSSVSTSTAVLNSARFPLVSPAGTIPYPKGGSYHIVDGGYFENGGLETIYDVARYLRSTVAPSRPILIIEINNDDAAFGNPATKADLARYPNGMDPAGTARITLGVALPDATRFQAGTGFTSVLQAFLMTRTSRGVLGAKRLSGARAIGLPATYRAFFNLGPILEGRQTAMSWALSGSSRVAIDDSLQAVGPWLKPAEAARLQALRAHFDQNQLCQREIADAIAALIGATSPAETGGCKLGSLEASWIGLPLGLGGH
ncbi:MAG: hypothetical protein K2W81_13160 [Sphingomonas sp.]|uniref:hypothetical protein n=1 Tax=Sphingomonas sp. TaxID=28214 RepID=UPI0025CC8D81|nr:hypothetical protein [Sphingomonas sp.]MBY0284894.1 hypothetical protein [Sphingomonas sp.]